MKKNILLTIFALVTLTYSNLVAAAPGFEGVIKYDVNVNADNLPPEAKAMMSNNQMAVYCKGERSRTEIAMGPAIITIITDTKAKTSVNLTEVMGQKYMSKTNLNETKKDAKNAPKIKYLNETKTIAGYACKKAEISFSDENGKDLTTNVFYTEELPYFSSTKTDKFAGLKGCPMEFEINQRGMNLKMVVKSVEKTTVDESKFKVPTEGYKEVSPENMMGGQH